LSSQEPHSAERRRQYSFGDFTLDCDGGFLRCGGEEIALRPKSFEVLVYLVEYHGRLVNREELMRAVWPDVAVTDESVTKCIADIRKALADDAQQLVRTVARRGYMFTAPVITPVKEFSRPSSRVEAKPGPLPVPPNPASMKASVRRWLWIGIAIVVLGAAGAFSLTTLRRPRPEPIRSILVLPFVNMSSSTEDEYLGDGLSEEVINALAAIPSLQVVARTSAFQLKGTRQDIRQIGIQFHADTVLEGSVRRQGDRVRITAQLNSAPSGANVLSVVWGVIRSSRSASVLCFTACPNRAAYRGGYLDALFCND